MTDTNSMFKFSDFFVEEENYLNLLEIKNLPNKPIQTKLDEIIFCFYLFGVSDEKTRETLNNSRITPLFWEKFREIPFLKNTFNDKKNSELCSTFKFISYFDVGKKYNKPLILKMFFFLLKKGIIKEKQSVSEIAKLILNKLDSMFKFKMESILRYEKNLF